MSTSTKRQDPSSHIDLDLAKEIAAGGAAGPRANEQVGYLKMPDGSFCTGFVHFEQDTGLARVSEKGNLRINWRAQKKAQVAQLTAKDGTVVTAEQVAAFAKANGLDIA